MKLLIEMNIYFYDSTVYDTIKFHKCITISIAPGFIFTNHLENILSLELLILSLKIQFFKSIYFKYIAVK